MSTISLPKKFSPLLVGAIIGALLTSLAGIVCLLPVGDGLARASYDLPFLFRSGTPNEVVMVYLDSKVKLNLGEPTDAPLDRRYYTQLLQRLTDDGAKLVFFDITSDAPSSNPATDEQFAQAIHRNGRVVLVAVYITELQGNVAMQSPLPPLSMFTDSAGWGLAKISYDADYAIRQLDTGVTDYPSASWSAAALLNAPVTKNPQSRLVERWLDYYCPPDQFRAVDLDQAIARVGLPPGYFHDKIVVVGSRPSVEMAGAAADAFANPFSRFGRPLSTGPSVHALSLLNLLNNDWLTRLEPSIQFCIVIAWGIFISLLLAKCRPWNAVAVALLCAAAFAVAAIVLQLRQHVWFAWLIPAVAQTPVALVSSICCQYWVETRRRRQLRRAFAAYLSPYMADRIANSEFDLALGGEEVEASVMFTDLEGFTTFSESLPPAAVSKILTTYFNQTTSAILDQEGTIIKYIGDAVMAVWGAPLPDKRHAQRAVLAAWEMTQAGRGEIEGRRLRTRIGVSTGIVLSGNLGSKFRFDYTCIGDTTNVAARLEGLNKYFGTQVLISEFTAQQLDGSIKLRPLGRAVVAGRKNAIGIFEVLGPANDLPQTLPWLTAFAGALAHYQKQELDEAESGFRSAIAQRGGDDGPSAIYLEQISKLRAHPKLDAPWTGDLVMDLK